jgi:hypothetical protein
MEEFEVQEAESDADLCWRKFETIPELALDELEEEQRDLEAREEVLRERRTKLKALRSRLRKITKERRVSAVPRVQMDAPPELSFRSAAVVPKNRIDHFAEKIARVYAARQSEIARTESLTKAAECANEEERRSCEAEWQRMLRKYERLKAKTREREQVVFEVAEMAGKVAVERANLAELEMRLEGRKGGQTENERLANWEMENKARDEELKARSAEIEKRETGFRSRRAEWKLATNQLTGTKEAYRKLRQQVRLLESSLNEVWQEHDNVFRQCQIIETEIEADRIEALSRESINDDDWDCSFS